MSTSRLDFQDRKLIHGVPVTQSLAEEIERALEMLRRVRTADIAQDKGKPVELPRTKYLVPKPLLYPVTRLTDRQ